MSLLDTQIALWWYVDHPRLTSAARTTLESHSGDLWVSRASLWEVAIKVSAGKLPIDIREFSSQIEQLGFRWLEIENAHLLEVAAMPLAEHKDPFDRLLVAQAKSESLQLVTADPHLQQYGDFVVVV